jgi:misacylated tRNA(Ala) deacylase
MAKDYPPGMHTAEHILNQTMVRMFNCGRSFSNHLEKKKSKCDYHFDRDLSQHEITEIQSRVNSIINEHNDVNEEFLPRDRAGELFDLDRLPDAVGEIIRIIKVGEYDACPCIGQHVKNTSEIGEFRIISTGFENGVLRIRFKIDEGNAGQY